MVRPMPAGAVNHQVEQEHARGVRLPKEATVVSSTQQFETIGRAALVAGITEAQLRGWVRRGLVPTRTIGHRRRPHYVEVEIVRQLAAREQEGMS